MCSFLPLISLFAIVGSFYLEPVKMAQLPTSIPLHDMASTTPPVSPGSLHSHFLKSSTDHSRSGSQSDDDDDDDDLDLRDNDLEATGLVKRQRKHPSIFTRRRSCPRVLHHVGRFSLVVLRELAPSFLHGYFPEKNYNTGQHYQSIGSTIKPPTASSAKKLAALDGIRGVACLIVFNFHFLYPYSRTIMRGYMAGSHDDHYENMNFHQLPFICLLHRGRAAVCIFFAVSGYVLSYRFLQLVRARTWAKAYAGLSSLAFRRGLRLYLPPTISLLCVAFAAWLGAFERGAKLGGSPWTAGGEWEPHPRYRPEFKDAWLEFYKTWWFWADAMTWDSRYIEYDPHLWTIPIEMRSSMVLFLALLATAPLKPLWRVLTLFMCCTYSLSAARWDVGVFLGGAIVAEFHLIFSSVPSTTTTTALSSPQAMGDTRHLWRGDASNPGSFASHAAVELPPTPRTSPSLRPSILCDDDRPGEEPHKPLLTLHPRRLSSRLPSASSILEKAHAFLRPYHTPLLVLCLTLSLFLLSFPDAQPESTPGFRYLADSLTPRAYNIQKYYFWHSLGSLLFVFTLPLLPRLARCCFESSVPQYLGRISYALYLCHGPIMHSLGFAGQPWIWRRLVGVEFVLGAEGGPRTWTGGGARGWCVGLLLGWVFMLVVVVVVADVFWRYVDVGCVRFARAVEGVMVSPVAGRDVGLEGGQAGLPLHRISR